MGTKNVNTVHFKQINHKVEQMHSTDAFKVLKSPDAWDKYPWVREYFDQKPQGGYFVWVKESSDCPILTCVSISGSNVKQSLSNLLVVDNGVQAELNGECNVLAQDLGSEHNALGKIVLREGSILNYNSIHSWGGKDKVITDYEFTLEKNTLLNYRFRMVSAPKLVDMQTKITLRENAKSVLEILSDCSNTEFNIHDITVLEGDNSSGISKIKLVGRENANICARSQIVAAGKAKGHLECDGLMIDDSSKISLLPQLDCENKDAELTHEASVGKISEEQMTYLRMRGLTEEQALNLIVSGFLQSE